MATNNREFKDRLVRVKDDTSAADPARWAYVDPESFLVTVGGTASDGNYVVTIVPRYPPSGTTSFAITFTRAAAETNTAIGAGIDAATDVLLAVASSSAPFGSVLSHYIKSVSNSAGVVQFIGQPEAPEYTVTVTAPGTGTLTLSPDDIFPITFSALGFAPISGPRTDVEVLILPVDSSGVPLDPNGATIDVTCLRVIDRGTGLAAGVGSAVTESALPIGDVARIPFNGGRLGFLLSTITGTITGLDALEVWVREVTG